jgi:hypothetical protein
LRPAVRLELEKAGSDSVKNLVRNDLRINGISYHNDFPVIGA